MLELKVANQIINYTKINDEDYISITDMLKSKDGDKLTLKLQELVKYNCEKYKDEIVKREKIKGVQ